MKNFIFVILFCIFLIAAEAKYRNTAVRDQYIRELAPARMPLAVHQRVHDQTARGRLVNGDLTIRAEYPSSPIQPINRQPNQYHNYNQYQNQNQNQSQNQNQNQNQNQFHYQNQNQNQNQNHNQHYF